MPTQGHGTLSGTSALKQLPVGSVVHATLPLFQARRPSVISEKYHVFICFGKPKPKGERGGDVPEPHEGLPDTSRLGGLCPRCGKQSSFELLGSLPVTFSSPYYTSSGGFADSNSEHYDALDQVSSLICRHCKHCVAVIEERWIGDHPAREGMKEGGHISYRGVHWWPLPDTKLPSDIPADVASAYAEAAKSALADCPRASAVMARRTLEAIAVDKGEREGNLAARLNAMSTRGLLHPTLADWAKEVRLVGNTGAHYDVLNPVTSEDAKQLLSFVRELMRYLYEMPADLARRRQGPTTQTPPPGD